MKWVIDGYNLIGKLSWLEFSNPQKEHILVQYLHSWFIHDNDECILVFDGKNQNFEYGSSETVHNIMTVFTDTLETADDYIVRFAKNNSNTNVHIVSSDKDIAYQAKKFKVKTIRSEEFIKHYKLAESESKNDTQVNDKDIETWMELFS